MKTLKELIECIEARPVKFIVPVMMLHFTDINLSTRGGIEAVESLISLNEKYDFETMSMPDAEKYMNKCGVEDLEGFAEYLTKGKNLKRENFHYFFCEDEKLFLVIVDTL